MYTRLSNTWSNFRGSFWFVPSMLMAGAAVAAFALIRFDSTYGQAIVSRYPMFEMSPPAARSILSSIVAAMVSTTGVVFSITIVALSLASSQFGSRLIRTYRNRRSTHFTLGIFVSTSLYCILVLASIREVNDFTFVPTAAVVVGILLTVVCLSTLIYYIHDMSRAIQAPFVIQRSADDLHDSIEELFPESFGEQVLDEATAKQLDNSALESVEQSMGEPDFSLNCDHVGYLQAFESETLMDIGSEKNVTIRLFVRPGDFLFHKKPLAEVWCHSDRTGDEWEPFKESIAQAIRGSLIVGAERTHLQDIRYAFCELVEIAVRALSPGINDPYTAVNCVDRIHAGLMLLKERQAPSPYRLDEDGHLCLIASPVSFAECIKCSLDAIRSYAEGNPMVVSRIDEAMQLLDFSNEGPVRGKTGTLIESTV